MLAIKNQFFTCGRSPESPPRRQKARLPVLLIFLLLALPATLRAQYGYMTNFPATNTITITNYTGTGGAVTIPSAINGLTVTSIGDGAFQLATNLISVTIPSSVTSIGAVGFEFCAILTNIALPDSVTN